MTATADITIEAIVERLRAVAPAIKAHGVTRLSIFGSRARGDARPDSDLDVLIETDDQDGVAAFDFFKVNDIITSATGLSAQLSQRRSLKPRIVKRISDDLIEIF